MKKINLCGILIFIFVIVLSGCSTKKMKKVKFTSFKDSVSYAIGADVGKNLRMDIKQNEIDIDMDMVFKGFSSQLKDTVDVFNEAQKNMIIDKLRDEMRKKSGKKIQAESEKNIREGAAFLEANKKRPGVKVTASGLQYEIIKQGTGKFPKDSDVVTVNYVGKLINGKVFDSSLERKQPATFQLNKVIKGWVEGIQLIREGGKIILYIPADLGYGNEPGPIDKIKAGSTLIFEVELLKVGPPAPKK